ncbi:GIY-YIG nuclease family protein [Tateyamaria sp. SN6-1]|uniref:GIY-YIG nuclease family protein n=1 Tax=Tateyamaria sp. SN6-1 TaxID=3092148 RepID=UPI0039F60544
MTPGGRSLELFFVDGRPDGLLTAEVFNWTGHVLRIPRTQIAQGLARATAARTGVYILVGERDGDPLAYIGETENMATRLQNHVAGKDWWDVAILISAAGDVLHKAHVKYLEARLIETARAVGRVPLDNGTAPARPGLTEAARANMEGFLDVLNMVLPAIRLDMFLDKTRASEPTAAHAADGPTATFVLRTPKHGVEATAILQDGELVVQKGSTARATWAGSTDAKTHYGDLHAALLRSGVLVVQGRHATFAQNYAFSSPSAAGAVVNGRSTNGRVAWIEDSSGKTFAQWEALQIEKALP